MSFEPLLSENCRAGHGLDVSPTLSEKMCLYDSERPRPQKQSRKCGFYALIVSILLNIFLVCGCTVIYCQKQAESSHLFWTPFTSRLKYHVEVFSSGFGHDVSPWQGNASAKKDSLWRSTYVEALTIPKAEAQKLANKTVPATHNPDNGYVTSFSVFHYLHCLDMVRQVTEHVYFPEYYNMSKAHNLFNDLGNVEGFEPHAMYSHEHIDHCIDSLRQALSCQPDLGPVVWQWTPKRDGLKVFAETVHTCANFEDLLDYANENRYDGDIYSGKELEAAGQCGFWDEGCGFQA